MPDPIAGNARAAADRLAAELGPNLVVDVEAALHARDATRPPEQYFDPVSSGALIVSVAALAWTVYTDLSSRTTKPSRDVAVRAVRVQLQDVGDLPHAQRDRIIDIVVSETIPAEGQD